MSAAAQQRIDTLIWSLKGAKIPGLKTLSRNCWAFIKEAWILDGEHQVMGGGVGSAMGTVKGLKGAFPLTPTSLSWGTEGTRFWSSDGNIQRKLQTATRFLFNGELHSFLVVGNYLNFSGVQQYIISQNTSGGQEGRQVPGLIEVDGSLKTFGQNGNAIGTAITATLGQGSGLSSDPRAILFVQDATHRRIYVDGIAVEATSIPHAIGTCENTVLTIGNLGNGGRPIQNGTLNLILAWAAADAGAVVSGADYAKIVHNIEVIFNFGIKGTGKLRALPSGKPWRQVMVADVGRTNGTGVANGGTRFLGSPDVVEWPEWSGDLMAYCDEWGTGATVGRGYILRRPAGTKTWSQVATNPASHTMFWGRFITEFGYLLQLGTSQENGSLIVRKSIDNGVTWTGATLSGSANIPAGSYSSSALSCAVAMGRLWAVVDRIETAAGQVVQQGRPGYVRVISCALSDDPMVPANWKSSNEVAMTPELRALIQNSAPDSSVAKESLEHEIFEVNGVLKILGRTLWMGEIASVWALQPDVNGGVLACMGGNASAVFAFSKFRIQKCPVTGVLICVGNKRHPAAAAAVYDDRTRLCVWTSVDGEAWDEVEEIEDLGEFNATEAGICYPSFKIVGTKIVIVVRAGWNGANSYHNSNRILELEIANYRSRWNLRPRVALPANGLNVGNSYSLYPVTLANALEFIDNGSARDDLTWEGRAADGYNLGHHLATPEVVAKLAAGVTHFVVQWYSSEGAMASTRATFLNNLSTLAGMAYAGNPECRIILNTPPSYAPGSASLGTAGFATAQLMYDAQREGAKLARARIMADHPGHPPVEVFDAPKLFRSLGAYESPTLAGGGANPSYHPFHAAYDLAHQNNDRTVGVSSGVYAKLTGISHASHAVGVFGPGFANMPTEMDITKIANAAYEAAVNGLYWPLITAHPQNVSKVAGESTTFAVTAEDALRYQWYVNGVAQVGQTSKSFTMAGLTTGDNGKVVRCDVTGMLGTVSSANAVLTVSASSTIVPVYINLSRYGSADDITYPGDDAANRWNNIEAMYNDTLADVIGVTKSLVDYLGNPSPITFRLGSASNGGQINFTGATGVPGLPSEFTQSSWIHIAGSPGTYAFEGFAPGQQVRFRTNAFRNSGVRTVRQTYTVGAGTAFIEYDAGVAYFAGLHSFVATADSTGKVVIVVSDSTPTDLAYGYVAGWIIDSPP